MADITPFPGGRIGKPDDVVPDAIYCLKAQLGNATKRSVPVSADAVRTLLSYVEFLEAKLDSLSPPSGPEAA